MYVQFILSQSYVPLMSSYRSFSILISQYPSSWCLYIYMLQYLGFGGFFCCCVNGAYFPHLSLFIYLSFFFYNYAGPAHSPYLSI